MKLFFKLTAAILLVAFFAFIPPKHSIAGKWVVHFSNGYNAWVDFNADGTFRNYDGDGKTLHEGSYKFSDDVFSTTDKEGCGESYWGTYKFSFINIDSAKVSVITDSCTGRMEAVNNSTLRRVMRAKM